MIFETTRAAHCQAAEAQAMAHQAVTALQAQAQYHNHMSSSVALLQARVLHLEETVGKLLVDNAKLISAYRKDKGPEHPPPATEEREEPQYKRLRASALINMKDDEWRAAMSDSSA